MSVDQLFLSHEGRLVLGGLDGAVLTRSSANLPLSDEQVRRRTKGRRSESSSDKGALKPLVPVSQLSTSAPEVVLGGAACEATGMFAAAAVCAILLTGQPAIKVSYTTSVQILSITYNHHCFSSIRAAAPTSGTWATRSRCSETPRPTTTPTSASYHSQNCWLRTAW